MTTDANYGIAVFEQHAAKLAASAVSVDVARQRGYVSADTKAQLEREGFSVPQRRVPALVIPLWNVLGERAGAQLRPDHPRMLNGRPVKYETQAGAKLLLDVPPAVRPHLGDPTRALIITEGPIKADAAVTAGLDCVALLGVWAWRGSNNDGGKVALPDWEYVALNDRLVVVAFDSDVMLKSSVYDALGRFGRFLEHRGANVTYTYLAHGDGGAKIGLDDWLAAGNSATSVIDMATPELRQLAAEPSADSAPPENFDDIPDEPGWQVLDDVAEFLDRFVVWPSTECRDAVVLWIAHTHVLEALDYTPRLALTSPVRRCAKTRVLELIKRLARRARHEASMSASYMFRMIEEATPTLLFDEVDTVFGESSTDDASKSLRGLINAGFERGATVGRTVGEGGTLQPKDFDVFCPVALAGIGSCIPETIIDRAINIRMRRRMPNESVEPFRRRRCGGQAEMLRRRLGAWAETAVFTIEAAIDSDLELPAGVVDRAADTWEPLVAVAVAADGDWPKLAAAACEALTGDRAELGTSGQLITDIAKVFIEDRLFSKTLVERLNELEESPWGGWNKGDGMQPRDLANQLAVFDIRSSNVRVGGEQRKGYERDQFADAFDRYLLPDDTPSYAPAGSVPPSHANDEPSDQGECAGDTGTDDGLGRERGPSQTGDDRWSDI